MEINAFFDIMESRMKKIILISLFAFLSGSAYSEEQYYINNKSDQDYYEFINLLAFGNKEERVYAAENLRYITSKKAVRPLIQAMKGNPDFPNAPENAPIIKFTIAQTLANMGQELAVKPLIEEYKKLEVKLDENAKLNFSSSLEYTDVMAAGEMLRAIGRLGNSEEIENTLNSALSHKNYYIRSSAADGMREMNKKSSIEKLKASLSQEKNDYAKTAILTAIVSINLSIDENFKALTEMLKNEDSSVRYRTSQGLGEIDLKVAEIYLKQALLIEEEPTVREQLKRDLKSIQSIEVNASQSPSLNFY